MDEEQVISDYLSGTTLNLLGKKYKCRSTKIKEVLIKNGIAIKGGKIHSDICKRIVEMYNAGMNGGDISNELNINDSTIYKILNRENVEIRPYTLSNRKYEINENYFDQIDTEDKAYFFGLLFADGTIDNTLSRVEIQLQCSDKYILELLISYIQPDRPLYFVSAEKRRNKTGMNVQDCYKVHFGNIHLGNTLYSHGMVPRKSLIKTFPEVILNSNEDIIRHFIRGYFDGNGSVSIAISKYTGNISGGAIEFHSSKCMCEGISAIISKYITGIKFRVNQRHTCFCASNSRQYEVIQILDWVYKDSTIYLHRKYNKYLLLKEHLEKKHDKD